MTNPSQTPAANESHPVARPARRWRRLGKWLPVLLIVGVVSWYAVVRICSPWNAVRVVGIGSNPPTSDPPQVQPRLEVLRIGCYNIAHGRGSGDANFNGESLEVRDQRLSDIAQFLRDADLDVVVLNEVDFDSAWSGGVNQAEVIARRAGFLCYVEQRNFDVAVPFFSLRFGNAILSRHPLLDWKRVDLPGDAAWETLLAGKKNGSYATVVLPGFEGIRIFATHLSYRSEAVKIGAARAIIETAEGSNIPMIVAGDFNSSPAHYPLPDPSGTSAFDVLMDSGLWTTIVSDDPQPPELTFSSTKPDRAIDWILAPEGWELLSRQVFPIELSDHRPVIGVLRRKQSK